MKKLFSILVISLSLLSLTSHQARGQSPVHVPVVAGDTLVNADTLTRIFSFTDGYAGIILTPVVTKISGTVAGTMYLYESGNGTDWSDATDSLVLANSASRQYPKRGFRLTAPIAAKYKMVFITSGTQSYKTDFYYVLRRYATN